MKGYSWALGAVLVVAVIAAACSGGGGSGSMIGIGNQHFRTGTIHAHLKLMPAAQQHAIDHAVQRALKAQHRKSHYLPGSTTEIDFNLMSVGGTSVSNSPYNFSIVPGSDAGCTNTPATPVSTPFPSTTPTPLGYSCDVSQTAPAAADQYDIIACTGTTSGCLTDQNAVILSESYTTINVPAGGSVSAQFSLNPVVGGFAWSSGEPWSINGPNAPSWDGTSYSCGYLSYGARRPDAKHPHYPQLGCYDPILDGTASALYPGLPATPQDDSLTLNVLDPEGAIIIPASNGGTTYGLPVFLKSDGDADSIYVACTDSHVEWLTASPANIPDPAATPGLSFTDTAGLANGFTGSAAAATHAQITSPVSSTAPGTSTDFNNNSVNVYGNNGAIINFDGGSSSYSADQYTDCDATDAAGNTPATFYVGVGLGTINWGGDSRRLHQALRHHHH